jgi:hypothetical protein
MSGNPKGIVEQFASTGANRGKGESNISVLSVAFCSSLLSQLVFIRVHLWLN